MLEAILLGCFLLGAALIVARGLHALARSNHRMTQAQDDLARALGLVADKVAGITTVAESAVTTIGGLVDALNAQAGAARDAGDEAAAVALEGFADTLGAEQTKLAAAITASTPAAPGGGAGGQAPTISVSPTSITGAAGADASGSFSASGGASPYTYAADDQWPAELTLNADGTFSGSPSAPVTATSVVTATDANGDTGSATVAISIS